MEEPLGLNHWVLKVQYGGTRLDLLFGVFDRGTVASRALLGAER